MKGTPLENVEALNRYIAGKGYVEAAKSVFLSPDNQTEARIKLTILPAHMLGAFSLELFFKAWLLQSGMESAKVRKYSHDLNALYAATNAAGLPAIRNLSNVVSIFAEAHGDFTYRYIDQGDVVTTANWHNVFPVIDQLDFAVDRFIGASRWQGVEPGRMIPPQGR